MIWPLKKIMFLYIIIRSRTWVDFKLSLFVSLTQKSVGLISNDKFKPLKSIYFTSDTFTYKILKFQTNLV